MPPATVARCPGCLTEIPSTARFCPRCGKPAPTAGDQTTAPPTDLGKLPAPIPVAGILFLVALVVGPAAIIAGIVTHAPLLLYGGIAVAIGVVIVLLLGLVF
jgi:hypothetical protein